MPATNARIVAEKVILVKYSTKYNFANITNKYSKTKIVQQKWCLIIGEQDQNNEHNLICLNPPNAYSHPLRVQSYPHRPSLPSSRPPV
jgi:hypothetical protein